MYRFYRLYTILNSKKKPPLNWKPIESLFWIFKEFLWNGKLLSAYFVEHFENRITSKAWGYNFELTYIYKQEAMLDGVFITYLEFSKFWLA